MQRPSNFEQLSIEDKVTNIKRRLHDLQLLIRLRSKLSSAKPDQSQQPTKTHYQQNSNHVVQSSDVSPSQRASELDSLKNQLQKRT